VEKAIRRLFGKAWLALWWGGRRALRNQLPAPQRRPPAKLSGPARRPRLLWVCPYSLHPPIHGGAVRITNLLREAAAQADIYLLILIGGTDDAEQRRALAPWCRGVFFHQVPGQPAADPWGWRPDEALPFTDPLVAERVAALVQAQQIDILQLEYGELGHLTAAGGEAAVVLVEIDLAYRSLARRRRIGAVRASWLDELRLYRHEVRGAHRARQVHFMSAADRRFFSPHVERSKSLAVVPNGVDCQRFRPALAISERRDVLFLGSFPHLPNVDALDWLIAEIWPLVRRRRPSARLTVVGARPPAKVLQMDGRDGVRVVGEVDDVVPFYATHRLLAVPMRAGSGTRLKILEAFASGLPVVSTALGAEGIEQRAGEHLLLAEQAPEFALAMLALLDDEALATELAGNARQLVEVTYDWRQISARQQGAYAELTGQASAEERLVERSQEQLGEPPELSILLDLPPWTRLLEPCLKALAEQQSSRKFELLVIDWGPGQDHVEILGQAGARILRPRGAYHQARGLNQAAALARGRLLVLLDGNVVVADSGWLEKLARAFDVEPWPAAAAGLLRQVYCWRRNPWRDSIWHLDFRQLRPETQPLQRGWLAQRQGIDLDFANAALARELWQAYPFPQVPRLASQHWLRQIEASGRQPTLLPAAVAFRAWGFSCRQLLSEAWLEGRQYRRLGQRYALPQLLAEWRGPRLHESELRGWRWLQWQLSYGGASERLLPWLLPLAQFLGNRLTPLGER